MEDENHLYMKEFYVLWCSGIKDNPTEDTVLICSATVDEGSTTIIRIFHSTPEDALQADDKFLEWISGDPYISESSTLQLELIANVSPQFPFANAFCDIFNSFKETGKNVEVELKMVRLYNIEEGDDDYMDNQDGLRFLHKTGIRLTQVGGKDWGYLRQILRDKKGNKLQDLNSAKVRRRLAILFKNPQDASTSANVDVADAEMATDKLEVADIETMTEAEEQPTEEPPAEESSSSSSDEE